MVMARRRRKRRTRGSTPQLDKARQIVASMTSRGAQASATIAAAIARAGVSTRTYRTARAQLGTVAVRRSKHSGRRGRGKWFAKRR